MATAQEAIKRLTYEFVSTGADKIEAELKRLGKASGDSVEIGKQVEKTAISQATAFNNLERRYIATTRNQQDFAKVQQQVNAITAQYPALQERGNAILAAAADRYGQAGIASRALTAATSGLSAQLIALSAGAGPVGTFLAALGPWGLAAAVGLGAAEKAMSLMSEAAHGLAQKSEELRKFSEVTGLSTNQIQALRSEASKFGVTGDEVQSAIQQFTARFNDLRIGQGELLTQIRRVNPALADQMAMADNASDALTLFGKALQDVDNIFQRNALVKAATGKGGLSSASFLSGLDVDKVTQGYVAAGKALDEGLIKKLAQLDIDIAKTSAKSKENIASIFAQDVLEAELKYLNAFLLLSNEMKGFSQSAGWSAFVSSLMQLLPVVGPLAYIISSASKLLPSPTTSFNDRFAEASGSPFKPYSPKPDQTQDPRYIAEQLRTQISAMGEAATFAQRLALAQQDLAIKGKDAGLSQEQLARASGVLNLSFANQILQARIGLLGNLATVSEVVRAKENEIALANAKGAGIDRERAQAIVLLTESRKRESDINDRAGIGAADPSDIAAQKLREFDADTKAYNLDAAQQVRLLTFLDKKYRDVADASTIAGSRMPNFTRASLDAQNWDKQLDTLATNGVDHLATALTDVAMGNKTLAESFRSLGLIVIAELEKMIIKAILFKTISSAGLFSFLGFADGGVLAGGAPLGQGGIGHAAKGAAIDQGRVVNPYGLGGVFSDIVTKPTLFPMANGTGLMGEAGPEAIMPLSRGPDGRLGVHSNGGMASQQPQEVRVHITLDDDLLRATVRDESGAVIAGVTPVIVSKAVRKANESVPRIAAASARQAQLRGTRV